LGTPVILLNLLCHGNYAGMRVGTENLTESIEKLPKELVISQQSDPTLGKHRPR